MNLSLVPPVGTRLTGLTLRDALDTLARVKTDIGAFAVSHTGQLPSVTISFNLEPGVALGDAHLLLAADDLVLHVGNRGLALERLPLHLRLALHLVGALQLVGGVVVKTFGP